MQRPFRSVSHAKNVFIKNVVFSTSDLRKYQFQQPKNRKRHSFAFVKFPNWDK